MTAPNDIIDILAEWFPQAFVVYEARRRPLKIGIHLDIIERTGGAIERQELSRALRIYVANNGYLMRASRPGAVRVDLDGQPAGEVTVDRPMEHEAAWQHANASSSSSLHLKSPA
jgi:ProP effector